MKDLMSVRYKMIADHPNASYSVGDIITEDNDSSSCPVSELHKYPALFKRLAWWEERDLCDYPEYLMVDTAKSSLFEGDVHEVVEYFDLLGVPHCRLLSHDPIYKFPVSYFLPATISEYNKKRQPPNK